MTSDPEMSPEEQLAALGQAQLGMKRAANYGSKLLGGYSIILGLLLGGLAALLQAYRPDENFAGFIVITVLFVIAVLAMSLAYGRLYRSLPRGHSKLYLRGFLASMIFYALAVSLLAAIPEGWGFMVLTGVVVAAPLCLSGIAMVRK